ncbi:MAG: class I SAM-dependent methyltransferase [Gemmatimonadota bacterium]
MSPDRKRLAVHLYPAAERAVKGGHPWVYAEGIKQQRHPGRPGDLAVIFDQKDRFLAIGLFDPASPIRIRVLHCGEPETIDRDWFIGRIRVACELRQALSAFDTTGFRLVHGENDGLPGLVVDRYGDSVVVKIYTVAWLPYLDDVLAGLGVLVRPDRVVLRLSRAVGRAVEDDPGLQDGQMLLGEAPSEPVKFQENGLWFEADLLRGQKTGFFLDQRDNRARVEELSAGKSVLNVFAYTGGFSVYAARGGAHSVISLDASGPALAAAERNFQLNRSNAGVAAAHHTIAHGDAFELIPKMRDRGERFDVVVLDPPSFAKSQSEVQRALSGYARILRLGLDVLSDPGVLVAASCSSRITADRFRALVEDAAAKAGRTLDVLQQTGHPLDHPIGFPEGAYLKCVFADVGG